MERILLVDDDEDMMMLTSRWLSKEGYDVTMKTSGKAALSFLDENEVDLVILDYAMPEMDGPDGAADGGCFASGNCDGGRYAHDSFGDNHV